MSKKPTASSIFAAAPANPKDPFGVRSLPNTIAPWIVALAAASLHAAQPTPAQPTPAQPTPAATTPTAAPSEPAAELSVDPAVVAQALAKGPKDQAAAQYIALATSHATAPAWLRTLLPGTPTADDADILSLAPALVACRSQQAADTLRALLAKAATPDTRAAVAAAITSLTGHEPAEPTPEGFEALLAPERPLPESEWLARCNARLSRRADRLNAERAQAVTGLLQSLRRVHLATPADDRPALLAQMLVDPVDAVSDLGIDLAERELASANALGPAVARAAATLLDRPSVSLRARSARLLAQLSLPEAAAAARARLATETHPAVAQWLLRLASRGADESVARDAIVWLESDGKAGPGGGETSSPDDARACRNAAVELCWALHRAGLLYDADTRARVRRAVRRIDLAELPPAGCMLRASIGTSWDIEQVSLLLASKDQSQRVAAAEAVLPYPEHLDAVLNAAREDPRLIDAAVRGVLLHRQTLAGFRAIDAAARALPQGRRAALVAVATLLSAPDVVGAAALVADDPPIAEAVLNTLTRRERIVSERADPTNLSAIAEGLISLSRLRLRLGKPAEAVAALESLPDLDQLRDANELASIKTIAFIELNRLDQAAAAGGDVTAWLDGLEMSLAKPHALLVAEEIIARFSSSMEEDHFARLADLRGRIPAPQAEDEDPGFTDLRTSRRR